MSHLKFSTDLFLEKQELNRLKLFLDDKGFRQFLLANSLKFGLIDKQLFQGSLQNEFLNGKITQGSALSINYAALSAIDSSGNYLSLDAGNIATIADNNWYWIKIKYQTSPIEKGIIAVDANGNVTGDANTKFTEVLRGQPNFPSRIKFIGSTNNLLEYDVLEVIDDQNIILDNSTFSAEVNLQYKVIGTFTPSSVPASIDKDIFQYDSAIIQLVQETVLNTRPVFIDGSEFFLARVKNNGSSLIIQDKRTQIWQVKADFFANNLNQSAIPNFGIEKVKFNDQFSPLDKNIIYLSWAFRSSNYSVNSNLNILTIIGGQGGKYKKVTDFNNGNFNGYRVYTSDGTYAIIKTSILTGGQINCTLDVLNIDKYSNDGGTTFTNAEVVITPDAEEIEITFIAQEDESASNIHIGEDQLSDQKFVFPINTNLAKVELLVYDNPRCNYEITYRLKHIDQYGKLFTMPADTNFGYYTEIAFDVTGNYLPIVQSNNYAQNLAAGYIVIYSSNILVLTINPNAFSLEIAKIDIGDLPGVDYIALANANPLIDLYVGTNRQYEVFTGSDLVLSADMFINLRKTLKNIFGATVKNGVSFYLHFRQSISLSTFNLRIVEDFVNPTPGFYTELKKFTIADTNFIINSEQGLFIKATFDGTNWFLNSTNEKSEDWVDIASTIGFKNSWVNEGTDPNAKYKEDDDFIILSGNIKTGSSSTVAFTLPYTFKYMQRFTLVSRTTGVLTTSWAKVDTNGDVTIIIGGGTIMILDNMRIARN